MIAMKFDGARVLGAPENWDQQLDGSVGGLPVLHTRDTLSGLPLMYSVWRPTEDEIAMLLAGGAIRLGIFGAQHPVMNMAILTPETVKSANCSDHLDLDPPTG